VKTEEIISLDKKVWKRPISKITPSNIDVDCQNFSHGFRKEFKTLFRSFPAFNAGDDTYGLAVIFVQQLVQ